MVLTTLGICLAILIVWLLTARGGLSHGPNPLVSPNPALPQVPMHRMSPSLPPFGLSDLLFQVFFHIPVIFLGEVTAAFYLSRRHVKRSISLVIGSYLLLAAAVAFAFVVRDEFGFSFVPAMLTVWPWYNLIGELPGSLLTKLGNQYGIFLLASS
jgi:hypothetical protein